MVRSVAIQCTPWIQLICTRVPNPIVSVQIESPKSSVAENSGSEDKVGLQADDEIQLALPNNEGRRKDARIIPWQNSFHLVERVRNPLSLANIIIK